MVRPSTRASRRSADLPNVRGAYQQREQLVEQEGGLATWSERVRNTSELVALDLFCGAGGLSQGFHDAGFFVAAGFDLDPTCAETHGANFLSKSSSGDLTGITAERIRHLVHDELELPRVDVIVGGPPCQGFAGVGRAKIRSLTATQRARLDRRNHLYEEFVRFVEVLKPLCFVMENVPHLASFNEGHVAEQITADFDRIGYDIGTSDAPDRPLFLDAEDFGVPQTRRRLFYLGFRRGAASRILAPRATHHGALVQPRNRTPDVPQQQALVLRDGENLAPYFLPPPLTLADAIADLPPLQAPATEHVLRYERQERPDLRGRGALRDIEYSLRMRTKMRGDLESVVYDHVVRGVREDDREAFEHMPEGGTYADVPESHRRYKFESGHFEDRYFRLRWDQPSRAITAHIAKDGYWYIHPDSTQARTLSVREAARVQSFPDYFRFAGHRTSMYRQIGNAVPPLLACALAARMRESIRRGGTGTWSPDLSDAVTLVGPGAAGHPEQNGRVSAVQ